MSGTCGELVTVVLNKIRWHHWPGVPPKQYQDALVNRCCRLLTAVCAADAAYYWVMIPVCRDRMLSMKSHSTARLCPDSLQILVFILCANLALLLVHTTAKELLFQAASVGRHVPEDILPPGKAVDYINVHYRSSPFPIASSMFA